MLQPVKKACKNFQHVFETIPSAEWANIINLQQYRL